MKGQRGYFHPHTLVLIPWLFLEPLVTRCVTEVRGTMRGQRIARRP